MRSLKLWQKVGPPTWKRSGTLVFTAVMGVLLIGGTAMAANLGLLTSSAPGDRGYRLDVPRPPLSVTLPSTAPSSPSVDSTSAPEDVEAGVDVSRRDDVEDVEDVDGAADDDPDSTVASTAVERAGSGDSDRSAGETGVGPAPTSDRAIDDGNGAAADSEDDSEDDDDSGSKRNSDDSTGRRAGVDGRAGRGFRVKGDGSLDDD